jgi:hypothetical protein
MCYYRGLPDTLLPRYESYGIPRRMASHPRKPGGCDVAKVALSGPSVTHPDTIRPHLGLKMMPYFFRILPVSCEPRYGIEP